MTAPVARRRAELRAEVARALVEQRYGPRMVREIDLDRLWKKEWEEVADAAIALIVERCAGVAQDLSRRDGLGEWYRGHDVAKAIRALAPPDRRPEMNEAPEYDAPWQCVSANEDHGFHVMSASGETVCDLYYKHGGRVFHLSDSASNARLRAAAPELLEALRLMVAAAKTETWAEVAQATLSAHEAIAEATGIYEGGYDAD